ncbi:MAG: DUF2169 domain-containing protein [Polyangiaceae bacterium]
MADGLFNSTPYAALAPPLRDIAGVPVATAIVKATFAIGRDGRVRLHDEQAPIRPADVPRDPESPAGSLLYPTDLLPSKVGTDVILVGDAVSARPAVAMDVAVKVRDRTAALHVHGPRVYFASLGKVAVGPAAKADRVPIVYEKAYGGMTPDLQIVERRNPCGVGVARRPADLDGKPAPQIEHPARPIVSAGEPSEPAGYGAIPPHWHPRGERIGTLDAAWRKDRMPLLPVDADPRYFNCAHPSLLFEEALSPGDEIAILGMTAEGVVRFALPSFPVRVRALFAGKPPAEARPVIDTLLIEPEKGTFEISARASFPIGRGRAMLREIRLDLHGTP